MGLGAIFAGWLEGQPPHGSRGQWGFDGDRRLRPRSCPLQALDDRAAHHPVLVTFGEETQLFGEMADALAVASLGVGIGQVGTPIAAPRAARFLRVGCSFRFRTQTDRRQRGVVTEEDDPKRSLQVQRSTSISALPTRRSLARGVISFLSLGPSSHKGHIPVNIGRRGLIFALGGAAAWPRAQQPGRLPSIGFLGTTTASAWKSWTAAFIQRLRELGCIEGNNIAVEYRCAEAHNERFEEIASEFVRLKVDVIVTGEMRRSQSSRPHR
jgi:hypothetical protein